MTPCFHTASTFLVLCVPAAVGAASETFANYMAQFDRSYERGSTEFTLREGLFHQRLDAIAAQNARPGRLWTAGLNALTDRTDVELMQLRGWRGNGRGGAKTASLLAESAEIVKAPAVEVDWRHLAMAENVPNQGGCGSCWAVATSTMLQGSYAAQTNKSRTFSAQQLVNCVPNPKECGGAGGCQGATVELAMQYIEKMGLDDDGTQPYKGTDLKCTQAMPAGSFLEARRLVGNQKGAMSLGLKSWKTLDSNRAGPLMHAVMNGPVAISVGAEEWSLYSDGIFNGCSKDSTIDHAVVLFGYGEEANKGKYWTVRNSWGKYWGEKGFIRLLRQNTPQEEDKYCGTDFDPKAGIACKPYPDSQKVCGMCGLLFDSVATVFAQ